MNMTPNLKSYYDSTLHKIKETELYVKTKDLNTSVELYFLQIKIQMSLMKMFNF